MKRFVLSLAAVVLSATMFAQAQVANATKAPEIVKFKEIVYDFGKIKQNVTVTHDFVFSNVSDKPVVVESAMASCGCTTPVWPQAPVAKGKTDKISAGFTAPTVGPFTKDITVKLAGVDAPIKVTIKGEVLSPDDYAKYEKEKGSKKSK
jgi:hypothetical protein